jgi:Cu-Zn family superoxide dismutase
VHQRPCGPLGSDAGGHYQHAGATGSLEDREVWLDVTVNAGGNGHSVAIRPWSLDESTPRSVIVHALPTAPDTGAAGARLACIDFDGRAESAP